jgi:GDPmannose 4,6-dehydratase
MNTNGEYNVMKILSIDDAKKHIGSNPVVIVTGVSGQDGSFMADYLLANTNYVIFGGARRLSVSNHENVAHLDNDSRFHLINFDLTDAHSISQVISQLQPNYFINFAAQSFVKSSWDFPAQTWDTNTTSMIHILEAIRLHCPECRFYNAGSSEEFGDVAYSPQDEKHPLRPRSPYGASKAAARQLVKVYRESYDLYAIQGWLFNHEGTRRGEEFVTRKITKNAARIMKELDNGESVTSLELGNLDAKRDWTDAEDCVDAVWRMLNQDRWNILWLPTNPSTIKWTSDRKTLSKYVREYVVSSGENHSVREFVDEAFRHVGIDGKWVGTGVDEKFFWNNQIIVQINPAFYRPAEVDILLGNPKCIQTELGWKAKTTFKELVEKMVKKDIELVSK